MKLGHIRECKEIEVFLQQWRNLMHLVISSFTGGSLLRGSLAEYSSLMAVLQQLQILIRLAMNTARNLLVNAVAEALVMSGDYEASLHS